MNGQWIGEFDGSYKGTLIVNIDERLSTYEGIAYLLPHDKSLPPSAVAFETGDKGTDFTLNRVESMAIHPGTGAFARWDEVSAIGAARVIPRAG